MRSPQSRSEVRPALRRSRERGSVLVEFALVSLAFYLLIAGTVTFGGILHSAQVAQDVARIAAREIALAPLPATATFEEGLQNPGVRSRVFDPNVLVIDLDDIPGGVDLDAYFASLPTVNRAMRPLMIYDIVSVNGATRRLLRMPGALLGSAGAPSGFTVAIPQVVGRDAEGRETIQWLPVLEEVRTDRTDATTGPFSVASAAPDRGLVAVRVNVAVQSSAMGSFRTGADPTAPNMDSPNLADDGAVAELDAAPGTKLDTSGIPGFRSYDGPYGLGRVLLMGKVVRPYRRVVSAQAFFRREAFQEQSQ